MPAREPLDPDVDTVGRRRPALPPGRHLGLVFIGGATGTAARASIAAAVPVVAGIPVAILGINVVGAFVLGVVVEYLVSRGPDSGRRRSVRLLIGTGVMGGFTTYSTLTADGARLVETAPWIAVASLLAALVVGAAASFAGITLGRRLGRSIR
ncbi:fluoride efflux transporter FluC [Pseudolysinimonas sp.]|uniref:fluoride efflux transporter FluC n=1 Tax=Pseudolysinimonas sp. TaxID=2680009 RepID=UPI003F80EDC4